MRIYISGPMTGCHYHNRPAFDAAAKRLREQGHFVINPAELSALFGKDIQLAFRIYYDPSDVRGISSIEEENCLYKTAKSVMDADLAAVRSCDAIYLLRGWETSRGAKRELAEAIAHGLTIMQEGDEK